MCRHFHETYNSSTRILRARISPTTKEIRKKICQAAQFDRASILDDRVDKERKKCTKIIKSFSAVKSDGVWQSWHITGAGRALAQWARPARRRRVLPGPPAGITRAAVESRGGQRPLTGGRAGPSDGPGVRRLGVPISGRARGKN